MKFLPESNGVYKVNMKEKVSPLQWTKRIVIVILAIFIIGFGFQQISNFVGKEKVEARLNYAKVEGERLEYKVSGEGDYTIVFDGATAANLYEWETLSKRVQKELNVRTFVYNRNGYGFSSASQMKTPRQQAEQLKILLRKAGVSGNLILVGEEYGSLVLTNFADLYPESVKGIVLVQPFEEEEIKSDDFKSKTRFKYYKSKIDKFGASFGFTTLMDKFDKTIMIPGFEELLPKGADEEFAVHKNKKDYRQAVSNEIEAVFKYDENSQRKDVLSKNPLYIISNTESNLKELGNEANTQSYVTTSDSQVLSLNDTDSVFNGIKYVIKEAKKIAKKS